MMKSKKVQILDLWFSGLDKRKREIFSINDPLIINIRYKANSTIKNPVFGITIFSETGSYVSAPNTKFHNFKIDEIKKTGTVKYIIDKLPLLNGDYYVSISVFPHDKFQPYVYHYKIASFTVKSPEIKDIGTVYLQSKWEHIED
jgi:lipopolysaccharide transport system ATP-binding protein